VSFSESAQVQSGLPNIGFSLCKLWFHVDGQDLPIIFRGLTYSFNFSGGGRERGDTEAHLLPIFCYFPESSEGSSFAVHRGQCFIWHEKTRQQMVSKPWLKQSTSRYE
jgi:hypothetical protein